MDKKLEFDAADLSSVNQDDLQACLQLYAGLLISAQEKGSQPADVAPLHYYMGQTYDKLRQFDNAEIHYRAAAYSFRSCGSPLEEAKVQLLLGEVQAFLGFPDKAEKSFNRALELGNPGKDIHIQAHALYNLGRLKEFRKDLAWALTDFTEASERLGIPEDAQSQSLYARIQKSLFAVQIALTIQQARELAERINRDAEAPLDMAPPLESFSLSGGGQSPRSGGFPGSAIPATQGSDSWR